MSRPPLQGLASIAATTKASGARSLATVACACDVHEGAAGQRTSTVHVPSMLAGCEDAVVHPVGFPSGSVYRYSRAAAQPVAVLPDASTVTAAGAQRVPPTSAARTRAAVSMAAPEQAV